LNLVMNYAAIKKFDIANGPGVRVSLFVSGCRHKCKNCFNSEAWDFNYGNEFTNDTLNELLEAVKPKAVVVSCGEDNSYGHPHAAILNYCRMNNIPLYRTDMQGTIVAKSDGKNITWNMSPYEEVR